MGDKGQRTGERGRKGQNKGIGPDRGRRIEVKGKSIHCKKRFSIFPSPARESGK
jgi:hypothetical protein